MMNNIEKMTFEELKENFMKCDEHTKEYGFYSTTEEIYRDICFELFRRMEIKISFMKNLCNLKEK